MLWSMTHSPTPRYLSTHFVTSWLSPETLSVLKLGLGRRLPSGNRAPLGSLFVLTRRVGEVVGTHVRPVERFMPARKAETLGG